MKSIGFLVLALLLSVGVADAAEPADSLGARLAQTFDQRTAELTRSLEKKLEPELAREVEVLFTDAVTKLPTARLRLIEAGPATRAPR